MADLTRVLIIEDDSFARNWMALLLARDWRTHLAADVADPRHLANALADPKIQPINLALLDLEMPADHGWLTGVLQTLSATKHPPALLALATHFQPKMLQQLQSSGLQGFILKDEIHYSLAWAAALAGQGHWVMTPGVEDGILRQGWPLPPKSLVLEGRKPFGTLSSHQTDVARMALLFSLERNDLAQELGVSPDWSYGLVSSVYNNLGLVDLLDPATDPAKLLYEQKVLIAQLKDIRRKVKEKEAYTSSGHRKKIPGLESLAFHYLTMPEIREIKHPR